MIAILTVGVWHYHLPREFAHVTVTTMFVPPSANVRAAADILSSHVHDLDSSAPCAVKLFTVSWCFDPSQPQRIISGLKTYLGVGRGWLVS